MDAFKYSLAPTELQDRWNELDSYVYVISKTVFLDESKNQQPTQIFKIGTSTLSGQIQRLMNARSFLIQFFVHRIYLFEKFQLPGQKKSKDSATYAYKAEQQVHSAVEAKFKPQKVRMSLVASSVADCHQTRLYSSSVSWRCSFKRMHPKRLPLPLNTPNPQLNCKKLSFLE